jgi:hypothetical protein
MDYWVMYASVLRLYNFLDLYLMCNEYYLYRTLFVLVKSRILFTSGPKF